MPKIEQKQRALKSELQIKGQLQLKISMAILLALVIVRSRAQTLLANFASLRK